MESFHVGHLLSWMPFYLDRVEAMGHPFYCRWSILLKQALVESDDRYPGANFAACSSKAMRQPLPDPREHGFTNSLTHYSLPVRSGLIITRKDISQAAGALGLGIENWRTEVCTDGFGQTGRERRAWMVVAKRF